MNLRPATMDDVQMLLLWRNDPLTRENSRNKDAAQPTDHIAWLEKSLQNPARKLFIAQVDSTPVGTVRADEDIDGYTEISYTIAPEARGQGYGKKMVLQFVREQLHGKKLKAHIKKGGNEASEAIARALNLSPQEELQSQDTTDPRALVVWK